MTTIGLTAANTLMDKIRQSTKAKIVLCSFLIAIAAQISIPLPFSPVPVTLQTFAILVIGMTLGSKNGALSVLTYLAQSIVGLPVLAGGVMNPLALVGPQGGYLVGFVVLAYLSGLCFENKQKLGKIGLPLALVASCALLLCLGTLWLGAFIGLDNAFALGFSPFIPGELLKIMAVTAIAARNDTAHQS